MNTLKATDGNWLYNGEGFAKEVSGFGDLSKWEEVSDDFKTQWEEEHKDNEEIDWGGVNDNGELKCVYEGRMGIGSRYMSFTTYADGTPLKAKELFVQVFIDEKSNNTNTQGYVIINSTNNKNNPYYGALYFENSTLTLPLQQLHFVASPLYMIAEYIDGLETKVAQGKTIQARSGSTTPQVYEDITYVKIETNSSIQEKEPLIKIYAR